MRPGRALGSSTYTAGVDSMFATLLGSLPRPPLDERASTAALVEAAVRAQVDAGLEPITDGGLRDDAAFAAAALVDAWLATTALTDRLVKQVVVGPYTWGRARTGSDRVRTAATLDRAATLNAALRELAAAGCPLIEVHEPAATAIGSDVTERALFREAHARLLDGVSGTHPSLAITGGNADEAGIDTILAAPYASLAVDLITGPDNWRLVTATPGDLGIVCGALATAAGTDDGPEVLLWAAGYAASTGSRGPQRVGLATASSLALLPWETALRKLERLGEAARLADRPIAEAIEALDPRAVSSRNAVPGRVEPPPSGRPRQGQDPT
jgi:methionine synthase II (cobalamin-independent)